METKTIGISSLISAGLISLIMIVPSFFEDSYFCESRPELGVVSCDSFSKYVAENGKCVRNENTNLICREGWVQVTDDRLPEEETIIGKFPETPAQARYECNVKGCEVV